MFQFKIISSSKLLFSLKTLLLTMNCRALYSTKYSWHANYEGGDLKTFDPGVQWQLTKRKYAGLDTISY